MNRAKQKVNEEAYRLSELRLQNTLQVALAADARAMSFAGLAIASAAILIGLSDGEWAFIIGAILLVVSAIFAVISSRPVKFYAPGARFSDLHEDETYESAIQDIGELNDKHIEENERVMEKNATWLRTSFIMAIIGLGIAILGQICQIIW